MINTSLTIALHTSGPGQSLLSKQQEHSTVTWAGDGGSPSLLAEQPLVLPSCWDTELFRSLQASRSTAAHFQELLIETNPAVQSLGCITKTTPGNKSQSTHLQSRYCRSSDFLQKSHCSFEPGETLRGCFALSALPGLKYMCNRTQWPWIAESTSPFRGHYSPVLSFSIDKGKKVSFTIQTAPTSTTGNWLENSISVAKPKATLALLKKQSPPSNFCSVIQNAWANTKTIQSAPVLPHLFSCGPSFNTISRD